MKHQPHGVDEDERKAMRLVHSTPAVMRRHRSAPDFVSNRWGNALTRRSYECLTELISKGNHHTHRCNSCKKLAEVGSLGKSCCRASREWWGMFLDLSNVGSEEDDRSQSSSESNPRVQPDERHKEEVKI